MLYLFLEFFFVLSHIANRIPQWGFLITVLSLMDDFYVTVNAVFAMQDGLTVKKQRLAAYRYSTWHIMVE